MKPAAGLPSMAGTTAPARAPIVSNTSAIVDGDDLHDLDAERHAHLLGVSVEQPLARPRRAQVEHRDDIARRHAAQRAGRAAHAHVDRGRRLADEFESGRKLLQLERHAQPALDGLLARDRPSTAAAPGRATAASARGAGTASASLRYCDLRAARGALRRWSMSDAQPRAQLVGVEAALDLAVDHERDAPVSSDTTIATASFSSVRPIAARCREPSSLLSFGFTVSGRKQAAAAMRSSCTITAPSCSGDAGWKMLTSRS